MKSFPKYNSSPFPSSSMFSNPSSVGNFGDAKQILHRMDALEEVLCYPLLLPLPCSLPPHSSLKQTTAWENIWTSPWDKGGRSSGCGKLQERLKCRHSSRAEPAASAGLLLNQRKAPLYTPVTTAKQRDQLLNGEGISILLLFHMLHI